jgi:crossover junction endodeoxyribonuclease RuvC
VRPRKIPPPANVRTGDTIVLGVDPGTLITGYGVVARRGSQTALLACGTIRNRPQDPMPQRLQNIYDGLGKVMRSYHPDQFAIESAFYGKNAQSALKLGHARGVSILAAVERGIVTAEYSPREVKKSITGTGTATKEQVQFMVRSLVATPDHPPMVLDASDAIAVALCHLHRLVRPEPRRKSWKAFITDHPERVRK